ncbi:universal stress protein, partial [Planomicrobium okeanokoites]
MTLKYSHILVALDGSRQAEWAYKKAVDIALRNNAVLNLVNIIDNRSFGMVEAYDKNSAKRAK